MMFKNCTLAQKSLAGLANEVACPRISGRFRLSETIPKPRRKAIGSGVPAVQCRFRSLGGLRLLF